MESVICSHRPNPAPPSHTDTVALKNCVRLKFGARAHTHARVRVLLHRGVRTRGEKALSLGGERKRLSAGPGGEKEERPSASQLLSSSSQPQGPDARLH